MSFSFPSGWSGAAAWPQTGDVPASTVESLTGHERGGADPADAALRNAPCFEGGVRELGGFLMSSDGQRAVQGLAAGLGAIARHVPQMDSRAAQHALGSVVQASPESQQAAEQLAGLLGHGLRSLQWAHAHLQNCPPSPALARALGKLAQEELCGQVQPRSSVPSRSASAPVSGSSFSPGPGSGSGLAFGSGPRSPRVPLTGQALGRFFALSLAAGRDGPQRFGVMHALQRCSLVKQESWDKRWPSPAALEQRVTALMQALGYELPDVDDEAAPPLGRKAVAVKDLNQVSARLVTDLYQGRRVQEYAEDVTKRVGGAFQCLKRRPYDAKTPAEHQQLMALCIREMSQTEGFDLAPVLRSAPHVAGWSLSPSLAGEVLRRYLPPAPQPSPAADADADALRPSDGLMTIAPPREDDPIVAQLPLDQR